MDIRRILNLAKLLAAFLFQQVSASAGELIEAASWPEVWGDIGAQGILSGERIAPNGGVFEPRARLDYSFNLGLLPRKELYVFLETEFWMQRSSIGVVGTSNTDQVVYDFSKRELDINTGVAWNVVDRLELRVSLDARNNLNRGTSWTTATAYEAGAQFEARYYFGTADIYDVGRLGFVGVGYYPGHDLIGGDGLEFRAGLFAQAYATYGIPALRSYLYGHAKLIDEEFGTLRIINVDTGVAVRLFSRAENLEFRIGYDFTADIQASTKRGLVYGAIRASYGPSRGSSKDIAGPSHQGREWPEVWGYFGLSTYAFGDRVAPNSVAFDPIFMSTFNFNLGLLSEKRLYIFLENEFWVQRASDASATGRDPANSDVSQREFDLNGGLAWNVFSRFELRASVYGLNNLNRGGSPARDTSTTRPSGYQDGTQGELRYYFKNANMYDTGRLSFVSVGYYPSQTLVGGDGSGFHPGVFARAYTSYNIPKLRCYLYGDARFIAEKPVSPRLIIFDAGWAARPFSRIDNLEFRIGNELTADIEANTTRDLVYGAIRLNFSTR